MKKFIAMLMSLCMCAALWGCGGESSDTPERASGSGKAETQEESSAAPEYGNRSEQEEVTEEITEEAQKESYVVGICQLVEHDALNAATRGFMDALTEELGDRVQFDVQIASGDVDKCDSIVEDFTSKDVDLILGNATPALLAAANATTDIPVLGTAATSYEAYEDTFGGEIPANVSGTSDAVAFDEQVQIMIDTIGLIEGDKIGILYCVNEPNAKIRCEGIKICFESKGIVVETYIFSEATEMAAIVEKMVSECKAVYVPFDTTVALNDELVSTACKEKKVPLFADYGSNYSYMSLAIDYYELGRQTGVMAAQILLGQKNVSDIDVMTLKPDVVYNYEICNELGLTLPEDSEN